MFKVKNPICFEKDKMYYKTDMSNDFPIKNYISDTYGVSTSFFYPDDNFSKDVLDFLFQNGSLINFSVNGDIKDVVKDPFNFRSGFMYFMYKSVYIKVQVKSDSDDDDIFGLKAKFGEENIKEDFDNKEDGKKRLKTFTLYFYAPSNKNLKFPLSDFEKFIVKDDGEPKVHFFIKNQYGDYVFEPISVNLPKDLDLELNYGSKFLEVDKNIKLRLGEKPNGLFMFHGPPGTGKTTYIKYLAKTLKRDFIYIPTTMVDNFTSDPNCLHVLIQKPNSVIILEDAEKAIMKRQNDGLDSSAVSSLLNLSDGILSDVLKTSVILTYNCNKQDIDDALKRKGRLQVEYEFGPLSVEEAKKLAKQCKYPKKLIEEKITRPLNISEIYNLEKEVEFYDEEKKPKPKVIGFSQS